MGREGALLFLEEKMQKTRTRWIVGGFAGWFGIAVISIWLPTDQPKAYLTLIALQQAIFLICGIMGADWTQFARPSGRSILQGVVLGFGLYLTNILSGTFVVHLLELFGAHRALRLALEERSVMEAVLQSGSSTVVLLVFLSVVFAAPIAEEIFFRGALQGRLAALLGPKAALILTALVFAALHLYIIQFFPVMLAGLYLGFTVDRTKDLSKAVVAHSAANCLTFLAVLAAL